eukprot:364270-Chlamydomonas_euryale.AAC.9
MRGAMETTVSAAHGKRGQQKILRAGSEGRGVGWISKWPGSSAMERSRKRGLPNPGRPTGQRGVDWVCWWGRGGVLFGATRHLTATPSCRLPSVARRANATGSRAARRNAGTASLDACITCDGRGRRPGP